VLGAAPSFQLKRTPAKRSYPMGLISLTNLRRSAIVKVP
jgi:hypothetical protein